MKKYIELEFSYTLSSVEDTVYIYERRERTARCEPREATIISYHQSDSKYRDTSSTLYRPFSR